MNGLDPDIWRYINVSNNNNNMFNWDSFEHAMDCLYCLTMMSLLSSDTSQSSVQTIWCKTSYLHGRSNPEHWLCIDRISSETLDGIYKLRNSSRYVHARIYNRVLCSHCIVA